MLHIKWNISLHSEQQNWDILLYRMETKNNFVSEAVC
jgi:hypothetical protein